MAVGTLSSAFRVPSKRADQCIKVRGFVFQAHRRPDGVDLVAQTIDGLLARAADQGVEPFLDHAARERAGEEGHRARDGRMFSR